MKKIMSLLATGVILASCSTTTQTDSLGYVTLPIDAESYPAFSASDFTTSVKVIPLETNEESLLAQMPIKAILHNDRLVLQCMPTQITIFDTAGRFVTKLNRGKGPGEILQPYDIYFDPSSGNLEILDVAKKVKRYDFNGKFINDTTISHGGSGFCKIGGNYMVYNGGRDHKNPYNFTMQNAEGALNQFVKRSGDLNMSYPNYNTILYDDTVYFNANSDNTLYRLAKGETEPLPYLTFAPMLSDSTAAGTLDELADKYKGKSFLGFDNLRFFDDKSLVGLTIKDGVQNRKTMYDQKSKQAYKHPMTNFVGLQIGYDPATETDIFLFPPSGFELMKNERLPILDEQQKAVFAEIENAMKNSDESANSFVILLNYTRK